MDTDALIKIQDIVDRYAFKRKIPLDDWNLYLEHATDCVRELSIHHMNAFRTAQVNSVASGIFDMPKDMIDIISLSIPYNGELWTLTPKGSLDITTMQGYPSAEVDDGLLFYENFLDRELFVRRGGSIGGGPTFGSSYITFDGTDDYASIPINLNGTYTLVMKLNVEDYNNQQYVIDFRNNGGTGYITLDAADISVSSGTRYVDGVATSVVDTLGGHYIVITGMSVVSDTMLIGKPYTGAQYYDGGVDYIKIYDYEWSTTEITAGNTADAAIAATDTETLLEPRTTDYGARGGNNLYYFSPNWKQRKIYINGIPTETVILQYVSSGLNLTGDSYVPIQAQSSVERYLNWMRAEIDGLGLTERRDRERLYDKEIEMLRRTHIPSASEFKDILLYLMTQVPIR